MKRIAKVMGIALLALTVVQCKTKSKGSSAGSGAAPKTMQEGSAGPAAPGALTPEEATAQIQSAAATYVNSPTCQSNPESPSCTMAQQQADPANTPALQETVAAVSGATTTSESGTTSSGETPATTMPVTTTPATDVLPTIQTTLNDINEVSKDEGKQGWSTQQQWGVAMMVVGGIGALGGAGVVFVYRKHLGEIRDEAVAKAKSFKETLNRMLFEPVSDKVRDAYYKVRYSSLTDIFGPSSYEVVGDDEEKMKYLDTMDADDHTRYADGTLDEASFKQRLEARFEKLKAIISNTSISLSEPALKRIQTMTERMSTTIAAADLTGRGTLGGVIETQLESVRKELFERISASGIESTLKERLQSLEGRVVVIKTAVDAKGSALRNFVEADPRLKPLRDQCATAYKKFVAGTKAGARIRDGILQGIADSGVGKAAKDARKYINSKGKTVAKGGIASIVIGSIAMLVGGYAYSSGGPSSGPSSGPSPSGGLRLDGGTGGGDDLANYINTLGGIAVQIQPAN